MPANNIQGKEQQQQQQTQQYHPASESCESWAIKPQKQQPATKNLFFFLRVLVLIKRKDNRNTHTHKQSS